MAAIMTVVLAIYFCVPVVAAPTQSPAKWTILVYMNGHNTLDGEIPVNFNQMSNVGSTAAVNVVAEVARMGGSWKDHAYRYRITKGMTLTPANATMTLGKTDMGSPDALSDFVTWGTKTYPAEQFMLVLWGHGQGYRVEMLKAAAKKQLDRALKMDIDESHSFSTSEIPSASVFRTVSSDDVFGSKLYMSDLQSVLKTQIASNPAMHGNKLAILGFDACLMAMVENAYAFRDLAQVMVASQDLEPGPGWNYEPWLTSVTKDATVPATALAASIVNSYADAYQNKDGTTTMSETDLSKANALALDTSLLAEKMMALLPAALAQITVARKACPYYAPDPFNDGHDYFYHIDLGCFVDGLSQAQDAELKDAAIKVKQDLKSAVLDRYAGSDRVAFGSNGLCIYFPLTQNEFDGDVIAEGGYLTTNTNHPVDFVRSLKWADFLSAYYKAQVAARVAPTADKALRASAAK